MHEWEKWEIKEDGTVTRGQGKDVRTVAKFIVQKRSCKECGLLQHKTENTIQVDNY